MSTHITKQQLTMEHLNTTKPSMSMDAHVLATIQKDINHDPMIKCLVSNIMFRFFSTSNNLKMSFVSIFGCG
jgi:hypothetical protein